MSTQLLGTSADDGQYLELIRSAYKRTKPDRICVAVAYATHSGVADLDDALSNLSRWEKANKQWLVGIDHCRSDPLALSHLNDLPRSKLRIFDGEFVANRNGCVPRHSFHPKAYLLFGSSKSAAVVGSGNLSRTGLQHGVEAAASVRNSNAIDRVKSWFRSQWRTATPFEDVESPYRRRYELTDNRRHPQASEDDVAPESASQTAQLKPHELRKLRVCRHLWIEAGNVTRNRGPNVPGNQLMMKRNARVFFGFAARDLPTDTSIGTVAIELDGEWWHDRPLRFSNNSMDVLTLPVPEQGESYDQQTLHFEQVGVRAFKLTIGNKADSRRWRRRSQSVEGNLRMKSGRLWGVY